MVGTPMFQRITAKRRTFFSFHFQHDIWRANQVRQSWRFRHESEREYAGFFDESLWERTKRTNPQALKGLIDEGLKNTSATCVLTGEFTYSRPWVRYEIVKSLARGNGILNVHIHNLRDRNGYGSPEGPNPLEYIGCYLKNGKIFVAEWKNGRWTEYDNYLQSISLPIGWDYPSGNSVIKLSHYCRSYNYVLQNGSQEFPGWVDDAASDVGK